MKLYYRRSSGNLLPENQIFILYKHAPSEDSFNGTDFGSKSLAFFITGKRTGMKLLKHLI